MLHTNHLLLYHYHQSMESKHHKALKADSPEPAMSGDDSMAGTSSTHAGRYYECIFCRRGFSTAQALGGHMNIHRRERPRIRPANALPPLRREEGYHPYSRDQQWHPPAPAVENYVVYFPGSSSSMELDSPKEQRPGGGAEEEMKDLDLELRLGHGGRHEEP